MRHFYSLNEFSSEQIAEFVDSGLAFKESPYSEVLERRQIALLFLNESLRTRCSFEVATRELGGDVSTLDAKTLFALESEFGNRMDGASAEHVKEAIGVFSRYFSALGLRSFARGEDQQEDLLDKTFTTFLEHAKIPVFNMESALYHPCQALADLMTIKELFQDFQGRKVTITWANHPRALPMAVANSALLAMTKMGMHVTLAHPESFDLQEGIMNMAGDLAVKSGGSLDVVHDRLEGAKDADVVYAKSWGSLLRYEDPGAEQDLRDGLKDWVVDSELMSCTRRAYFMHCLPVRRNVVVSDEVIDSNRSVVLQEAENRLHAQKAILEWIFS
ncbi:MAG: N-acetylornithine carbamoyltransferase [Planctomycetota bacterium]|nr:N-acetylornithine carbamoyltransferase [Planctomycetota bacterium]